MKRTKKSTKHGGQKQDSRVGTAALWKSYDTFKASGDKLINFMWTWFCLGKHKQWRIRQTGKTVERTSNCSKSGPLIMDYEYTTWKETRKC